MIVISKCVTLKCFFRQKATSGVIGLINRMIYATTNKQS